MKVFKNIFMFFMCFNPFCNHHYKNQGLYRQCDKCNQIIIGATTVAESGDWGIRMYLKRRNK